MRMEELKVMSQRHQKGGKNMKLLRKFPCSVDEDMDSAHIPTAPAAGESWGSNDEIIKTVSIDVAGGS